jgi:hypothetical protein
MRYVLYEHFSPRYHKLFHNCRFLVIVNTTCHTRHKGRGLRGVVIVEPLPIPSAVPGPAWPESPSFGSA